MLKEMLQDFVERDGVVFTHTGRYTNSNNNCFVFDEGSVFEGMKVDLYSSASGCIKTDDEKNLWDMLNTDNTFFKVYNGELGEELRVLLHQLCKSKECLNKTHQVYFKTDEEYEIMVPLTSSHNIKHGKEYLWENKYYKTFNHKIGGSNPQNVSHSCNKMRGGFKAFDTTPMILEVK